MWILFQVPCPTPEGANAFFHEWEIADELGEVDIRLEGEIGLVPLASEPD